MKLNAISAFLRTYRRGLDAFSMLISISIGLALFMYLDEIGWISFLAFTVMFGFGYLARPLFEPYVRLVFSGLKKWYGPPLQGWLSMPKSTESQKDDRDSKQADVNSLSR